jgi:hypothetical protein
MSSYSDTKGSNYDDEAARFIRDAPVDNQYTPRLFQLALARMLILSKEKYVLSSARLSPTTVPGYGTGSKSEPRFSDLVEEKLQ